MKYLVVDTETTGLSACTVSSTQPTGVGTIGSEVLQIGGLVLNDNAEVESAFCHYCDCLAPHSSLKAFNVHGISIEKVRKYIPNIFLGEVLTDWVPEIFYHDVVLIGYNVNFDIRMIVQSLRNFPTSFVECSHVVTKIPKVGRHYIDVMEFQSHRNKLVQYHSRLNGAREKFFKDHVGTLPLYTNVPELLEGTWEKAHNALFDSIETYLLFMETVWNKKVFRSGITHV